MALGNTTAYHVLYMCVKSQTLKNYSTLKMLKYCAKRTTISQFEDVKRIRKIGEAAQAQGKVGRGQ